MPSINRYILIILCSFVSLGIKAQYDASFSHYFDMEPSFNPASVGKYDKLNINAAYAMDMAGFEHNPQTMYAAADIPFYFMKAYNGAGVQFMNDKIGLFTHKRLALQYAYKHKLFKGIISIGAQVGIISEDFEGDKADLDETSDPAFSTAQLNGNGVDLALGAYFVANCKTVIPSGHCIVCPLGICKFNIVSLPKYTYFSTAFIAALILAAIPEIFFKGTEQTAIRTPAAKGTT